MIRRLKWKILQFLTSKLLKAISEEEVLAMSGKSYLLGGHKLSIEQLQQIGIDAEDFYRSPIWRLIKKELEWAAFKRGRQARTEEDTWATHYMYYNLDLIEKFLENSRKLRPTKGK